MVRFVIPLLALSATAWAAQSCSANKHCPKDYPCCSQYGECGTGAFCLGGCDPLSSFSLDSCAPMPVCEDKTYNWDNLDNTALNTKYLGDASTADWTYSGFPKIQDGNLLMTMPKHSVGTLFANNHYIWYGKVSGKLKSSRGQGVVTAFILLSDVKDEIDYEFVGADLTAVQTNYYWQGVLNWHHGENATVNGQDTFDDWHTYEIDWTPDHVQWIIDGQVKRTLLKSDTFDPKTNKYKFPQTPARLQMSLWPAGQASNAKGTIDWAGGVIDWNSQDIQQYGYDYATVGQVSVQCYPPPSGTPQTGDVSYVYTSPDGLQDSIAITGNSTVLGSMGATGLDMNLGASSSSSSSSASASSSASNSGSSSASASSSSSNTVPTNTNGSGGTGIVPGDSSSGSSSGSSTDSGGSSSSSAGFSQGTGSSTQGNSAANPNERVLRGSLFAGLVAVVVLVTL